MTRVGGAPTYYPFRKPEVASYFVSLFEFYLQLYFCQLASFQLMGNHYHAVVYFEKFRELDRDELRRRARKRWGDDWEKRTLRWQAVDWQRFNQKLFDVSCFMQHVNGEFSKWFNRRFGRRGHFWEDRFKNPELLDLESVQSCVLYVELNAVRARLVKKPEDWRMGSAYWRWAGKKRDLLIPLKELFVEEAGREAFVTYRALLYYRGSVAQKDSQGVIPEYIMHREEKRGFVPGFFCSRLRLFTDGVAIGSVQDLVMLLAEYRETGRYRRRRHPISQLGGLFFTLREQRSHAYSRG